MSTYASLYEDQLPLPVKQPTTNLSDEYKPKVTEISLFCPPPTTNQDSNGNNNNNNRILTTTSSCINSINQPQSFRDWKERQEKLDQQKRVQHRMLPMVPQNRVPFTTNTAAALKKQVRFEPLLQQVPPPQSLPIMQQNSMATGINMPQSLPANFMPSTSSATTAPVCNGLELSMCESALNNAQASKPSEPRKPLMENLYRTADMSYLAKSSPQATANLAASRPIASTKSVPSYQFQSPEGSNFSSGSSASCGCKCPHQMEPNAKFRPPAFMDAFNTNKFLYEMSGASVLNAHDFKLNDNHLHDHPYHCHHHPVNGMHRATPFRNQSHTECALRAELHEVKQQVLSFQEQLMAIQQQLAEMCKRGFSPVPPHQHDIEEALSRMDAEIQCDVDLTPERLATTPPTPKPSPTNYCDKSVNTTDEPVANSTDQAYINRIFGEVNQLLEHSDQPSGLNSNAVKYIESDHSSESIRERAKPASSKESPTDKMNGNAWQNVSPTLPSALKETRAVDKSCVINALAEKYLKEGAETFTTSCSKSNGTSRRSGGNDSGSVPVSTTCYNYMGKYNLLND